MDLVVTPHPLVLLEQSITRGAELLPGETLATFLTRHGVDLSMGDWVITIGGAQVTRMMWDRTRPQHGQLIECRRVAGKSALKFIAFVALAYFTMGTGLAAGGLGGFLGFSGLGAAFINAGAMMVGTLLINKLLPPAKARGPQYESVAPQYSLSGGRNRARPYEPLGLVFGQVRVVPDYASQPYSSFEGDDQFQFVRFHAGINCGAVDELKVGTTPLSSYEEVTVSKAGFPGAPGKLLDWSNVDTIAGGTLESPSDDSGPGDYVVRTSSAGTVKLGVDLAASLYQMSSSGSMREATLDIDVEYRALPAGAWVGLTGPGRITLKSNSTKQLRRTFESPMLNAGTYEVRARKVTKSITATNAANTIDWLTLKSYQLDNNDYSSHPHVGIRIKATGQLNGSLDEVSWLATQAETPVWTTGGWVNVAGTRNPGAHILQMARGIFDTTGRLMAGMGLPDGQIDIEGLKGFMLHCAEKGYTFDNVFTSMVSCQDMLEAMATAGLGSISYHPGRLSVVWARDDQPVEAVINMANIKKGSFRVDYATRESAQEIEVAWVDRDDGWRDHTVRIKAPDVVMPRDTARLAPLGVTTEEGALLAGRFSMAQNIFQRKSVSWEMDFEHLTFRRWSLVALSHDMTQWGSGGRLKSVSSVGGVVTLVLDAEITAYTSGVSSWYVGLRLPGAQGYLVLAVQPFSEDTHTLVLAEAWPAGVALPGADGTPVHDTLWIFDFKAQPGQRLRVISIEPGNNLSGARISAVPEGPEFWNYVETGVYEAPPLPPAAAPLVASNLEITQERLGLNYDQRTQLVATFDISGPYDHAQVWAALSGQPLAMLGETRTRRFGPWSVDSVGNFDVEVRPFDALGRQGQVASVVYAVSLDPLTSGARFIKLRATSLIFRVPQSGSGVVSPSSITLNLDRGGAGLDAAANWTTLPAATLGGSGDERTLAYLDMPGDVLQVNVTLEQDGKLYIDTLTIVKLYDGADAPENVKDLTPPPMVENLAVSAGLSSIFVTWDAPTYTVGHGPGKVNIYGKRRMPGDPVPVFADAARVAEPSGSPGGFATDPGAVWHIWAKHETVDGVESLVAAGGTNGLVAQTALVGGSDLQPLLIEAKHLKGSIGGGNLLSNSGFETGLGAPWQQYGPGGVGSYIGAIVETVKKSGRYGHQMIGTGDSPAGIDMFCYQVLPCRPNTTYTASAWVYVESIAAAPALGRSLVLFEPVAGGLVAQDTSLVPGHVLGTWVRKVITLTTGPSTTALELRTYAPIGTVYWDDVQLEEGVFVTAYAPRPDEILPGSIGATEIANDAITTPKLAAESIVAGKLAAGAVVAGKISAGAIVAYDGVIQNGAIVNALLGNAAIDDAKILELSAVKLTAGDGTIGGRLRSANYNPGAAGWIVWPDGSAEFNNIVVRNSTTTGTIIAGAGTIGGIRINPFALYNDGFSSGAVGFALWSDGTAEFNQGVTFRGTLDISAGGGGAPRVNQTNLGIRMYNGAGVEVISLGLFG
ncbi:host specificity factor TipJ family phage tail protein [Aquincola tertiaricarbonis]|uniref:host specificity factor TipJ family phage tail protein n=1 Tax=Aquincola tertiaricarbonis TaxID=391953 RepID=UPI0012EEDEFA|nr:host specificity factor TipJ family phage tail protein [Aquincola tertiaricarbonis]